LTYEGDTVTVGWRKQFHNSYPSPNTVLLGRPNQEERDGSCRTHDSDEISIKKNKRQFGRPWCRYRIISNGPDGH
jgi:hypothetical protein